MPDVAAMIQPFLAKTGITVVKKEKPPFFLRGEFIVVLGIVAVAAGLGLFLGAYSPKYRIGEVRYPMRLE